MHQFAMVAGLFALGAAAQSQFAFSGNEYIGCVMADARQFSVKNPLNGLTGCQATCQHEGWFALVGDGCACSDDRATPRPIFVTKVDEKFCSTICSGDSTGQQHCGGKSGDTQYYNLYRSKSTATQTAPEIFYQPVPPEDTPTSAPPTSAPPTTTPAPPPGTTTVPTTIVKTTCPPGGKCTPVPLPKPCKGCKGPGHRNGTVPSGKKHGSCQAPGCTQKCSDGRCVQTVCSKGGCVTKTVTKTKTAAKTASKTKTGSKATGTKTGSKATNPPATGTNGQPPATKTPVVASSSSKTVISGVLAAGVAMFMAFGL